MTPHLTNDHRIKITKPDIVNAVKDVCSRCPSYDSCHRSLPCFYHFTNSLLGTLMVWTKEWNKIIPNKREQTNQKQPQLQSRGNNGTWANSKPKSAWAKPPVITIKKSRGEPLTLHRRGRPRVKGKRH